MTKIEKSIIGKEISNVIKKSRLNWQDLKTEIFDYGNQSYYPSQAEFEYPIRQLIYRLSDDDQQALVDEWKNRSERLQFNSNEEYLKQFELYIMEEIVSRASKATYYM